MRTIYCDGACTKAGSGGWAFVVVENDAQVSASSGQVDAATNNTMELMAAIKALESQKGYDGNILVVSDSQYVVQGITDWIFGWIPNGWRTGDGKPVKNKDHWRALHNLRNTLGSNRVDFEWVKGHANSQFNIIADRLAQAQSRGSETIFPATHRHIKTGGLYRVVRDKGVKIEATWEDGVLYEAEDGTYIVRAKDQFYDGRFEKLPRKAGGKA